jgi:hypothetical protein
MTAFPFFFTLFFKKKEKKKKKKKKKKKICVAHPHLNPCLGCLSGAFAVWVIVGDVGVEQIRDLRDLEKLGNTGKAEVLHHVSYSKGMCISAL